ncbi:Uncharacterised protein [uncultured archaeon]|nr:Uncharacterised protein [uncultured archaeon]
MSEYYCTKCGMDANQYGFCSNCQSSNKVVKKYNPNYIKLDRTIFYEGKTKIPDDFKELLTCDFCNISFEDMPKYTEHITKKHPVCYVCGKSVRNKNCLENRCTEVIVRLKREFRKRGGSCPICGESS